MIIEFTFNDKDYTEDLATCLEKGLINLEVDYTISIQKSIDMNKNSKEVLDEYESYNKFHMKFIKLLIKVKDSTANDKELDEFKSMLRKIVLCYFENWNDYIYFQEQLEIKFHESITDRSYGGEKLYYFIPCEKYLIL